MSDLADMFIEAVESDPGDDVQAVEVVDEIDNPDVGADFDDEADDSVDDIVDDDFDDEPDDNPEDEDGPDGEFEDDLADDDFNWDEIVAKYGDRPVKLKVQGEFIEVPLREVPEGWMRRADYSQKTERLAQRERFADWGEQVQASFERDPIGTLQAFAEAYGLNVPGQEPQADPYEDMDPDIAAVLRKMDQQEARHQQELEQLRRQQEAEADRQMLLQVKAEVNSLKDQFGDDLDELEMLRVAATYNMPLTEAAYHVMGKTYLSRSQEEQAAMAAAREVVDGQSGQRRSAKKRRASSTNTRSFDGSKAKTISKDDFDTIGELFEIELNSVQ